MSVTHTILPTHTTAQVRRGIGRLLRPHRGLTLITLATLLASNIAGLAGPATLGYIVDRIIEGTSPSTLTNPVIFLLVMGVISGITTAFGTMLVAQLGEMMLATLRERVVERSLTMPIDVIERAGTGDLLSRVSGDVGTISSMVRYALPWVVEAALTILLTVIGLGIVDWRFGLAGLCAVPIQVLTLRWYLRASGPAYSAERVLEGELAQEFFESIDGAPTIRAHVLEDRHRARIADRSRAVMEMALRVIALRGWFYGWLNVAEFVGLSMILVTGFLLVDAGAVTVGGATAAALYFHRLFDPINTVLGLFDQVQSAIPSLGRLMGVADMPEPARATHTEAPHDASISLAGIQHEYVPGHPVLSDITLDIASGERVALVGVSGAGKTTVAKLVAGSVTPSAGDVRVAGVLRNALDPEVVRQLVVMVSQEIHVFAGTLADDLRLAAPDASDTELRAALAAVGAMDWAERLPEGLEAQVGAGGVNLTPTQAQQLAFARIALRDASIVILDEATAEAGSAGARLLEEAADRILAGRTVLLVAHRLTAAARANRIVVMENGRIVEAGTHEALVAAGGAYAQLWAAWSDSR